MPTEEAGVPRDAAATPAGPSARAAAALVFVADLDDPEIESEDAHHLAHVLRLRPGERVAASDGRGRWRACRYRGTTTRDAPRSPVLEPDGAVVECPRPTPVVTIGFVPTKGDRPEWAVQKLTEAGVDRIAVLRSARAVVRWEGDRQVKAIDRLRRVAREAAAQSRRPWLPDVDGVFALEDLARVVLPAPLALAHPGGASPTPRVPAVAIGPEGGWDPAETGAGRPLVGLGPRTLRTETAAVAAGLLLCALRDGLVAPVE
jgi:16S rRNA (uracil1498-N3)-methyltransferase